MSNMTRSIKRKALHEQFGKFPRMLWHKLYNTRTWRRMERKKSREVES